MILSPNEYHFFTIVIVLFCTGASIVHIRKLKHAFSEQHPNKDKIFASLIALVAIVFGYIGVLDHYGIV